MWQTKYFKSAALLAAWTSRNESRYQIIELAVNNGWAVTYKRLRRIL